ncbi:MAG: TusE/DsrC/DsvC family sulfur relay protein [Marinobacterium sp.]
MIIDTKGNTVELDEEGYLYHLDQWTPEVAEVLAAEDGLELTAEHWEVIDVLRRFYQQFQLSPAMRPLVKAVAAELGPEKGRSIHLMKLFPGSPAKVAARLAGLPKPENCL